MSTVSPVINRSEIYAWLAEKAKNLGIEAVLITHQAKVYEGRFYLPVYIANSTDAYDDVVKLQELENTWNYQKPEPHSRIFLLPADEDEKPGSAEAYAPVQQAIDSYYDAFDAFRAAGSSEEAQKALQEMEAAKASELEASKQLDRAA